MPEVLTECQLEEPASWPHPPARLRAVVKAAVRAAIAVAPPAADAPLEVAVSLSGNERVRALNAQWRGRDRPTNVLSFPAPDMPRPPGEARHLGDLVLAGPVVAREAEQAGVPLAEHLSWLVIHGVLHLLGHDHQHEPERRAMEALERAALAALGYPDPHTTGAPAPSAGGRDP